MIAKNLVGKDGDRQLLQISARDEVIDSLSAPKYHHTLRRWRRRSGQPSVYEIKFPGKSEGDCLSRQKLFDGR